ncbi:19126_t:CDS:1, partial [Gigaspora rosea]
MEELQQSNQELHEVVSQLAESNRNFEQRLYTLERIIGIREERIRFLEEELNNTIEASTE